MTIEQTLTIPEETRHLTVDLPQPVPAGTVNVVLTFPAPAGKKPTLAETSEKLWELCKDLPISVDSFLEERHEETLQQYVPEIPLAERRYKSLIDMIGSCKGLDTMDAYFERKAAEKE